VWVGGGGGGGSALLGGAKCLEMAVKALALGVLISRGPFLNVPRYKITTLSGFMILAFGLLVQVS